MKKIWALQRKSTESGEWIPVFETSNYYKFCGPSINKLREADNEVISKLKEEIIKENNGMPVDYSASLNERYKAAHNSVMEMFRVVEGQIEDDCKDYTKYILNEVKENKGVYKYLWCRK